MGWGRYFLLGDIGQQLDIEEQRCESANQREDIEWLVKRIARLKKRNRELGLYLGATLELLVSKGIFSQEEIEAQVTAEKRNSEPPEIPYSHRLPPQRCT
jgi:hypothetical protein